MAVSGQMLMLLRFTDQICLEKKWKVSTENLRMRTNYAILMKRKEEWRPEFSILNDKVCNCKNEGSSLVLELVYLVTR